MLVQNAMHAQLVTINAQPTLPEAVILLQTLDVRRLLVLQDGCLVGLLTDGQVKRALSELGTLRSAWDFASQVGEPKSAGDGALRGVDGPPRRRFESGHSHDA